MVDPPREGVAEAVVSCREAGIKVTMVTGDHPLTAEAIARKCLLWGHARKVNIVTRKTQREVAAQLGIDVAKVSFSDARVEAVVIAGAQIAELSDEDWAAILSKQEGYTSYDCTYYGDTDYTYYDCTYYEYTDYTYYEDTNYGDPPPRAGGGLRAHLTPAEAQAGRPLHEAGRGGRRHGRRRQRRARPQARAD
eukprot:scaffold81915_cov45-Phaeocystis_antarctica.AAC.1